MSGKAGARRVQDAGTKGISGAASASGAAGMDGGVLCLNLYDVKENPALGSHDPSMMWDLKTHKYYSYSTDIYMPGAGLTEPIGIPVRSSDDLVHFCYEGTVLSEAAVREGRDNGPYPATANFWAPYAEYVRGEYRLYYSATRAFGSSESRIWLAVADNPTGPFENRGVVADTWGTDDSLPNAIDPHVIWDGPRCYLAYGSFFGGIYLKELAGGSGLPLDGNPRTLGTCVSVKNPESAIDGPEGASVIYAPETGYFYLFQSYGWLGDNYDIRVGRSRRVTGPYLDYHGRDLAGQSMGLKLANSYRFSAPSPRAVPGGGFQFSGFRAPGHGAPFYDPRTKRYFFVHHIRDGAVSNRDYDEKEKRFSYRAHYLMIRPMFFVRDWPVLGPEPYAGEAFEPVSPTGAEGRWEMLVLDDEDNDLKTSREMDLDKKSEYLNGGVLYRCRDFENQSAATAVTGLDNSGLAYWGKFMYSIV